jgi:hypothetical protein
MTWFSHRDFRLVAGRLVCCGCGREYTALRDATCWRGNTVTPVCADADLAFVEVKP